MKSVWNKILNGHQHGVLSIAVPMVLSNITVPLLGMVDASVIGHLDHASYLAGVSMGGVMMNVILWLFGFLRMATTGISAQAYGSGDKKKQVKILLQGVMLSLIFSFIVFACSKIIAHFTLSYSHTSAEIKHHAEHYFLIRIFSCPASLINLVFAGWLLGHHQARKVMYLLIFINSLNILLDFLFVPGMKMGITGVAWASVISDYAGLAMGIYFICRGWLVHQLPKVQWKVAEIFNDICELMRLNADIFIRSLFLQAVYSYMAFKGAIFGDEIAAANAILMNFLLFVSYVMDGFAYTMEAFVGRFMGAQDNSALRDVLTTTFFWSLLISCLCTLIFAIFGKDMIHVMSSISAVRVASETYLPWLIAFPLISMWSFLLDGFFVGATLGSEMRNGMIIASVLFFASFASLHRYGNHALWASMLIFMAARWMILVFFLKLKRVNLFHPICHEY